MKVQRRRWALLGIAVVATAFGMGSRVISAGAGAESATDSAYYHLYDQNSGKCLDNWGSYTAGTQIRQYNCWNGAQQLWRTIFTYQVWDVIQNQFSGQCIWVSGNHTTTNGEAVVQDPCNYNFNSVGSMGENWYSTIANSGPATWIMSAVCVGQAACGYGYGNPTFYDLTETTRTNGAIATINYASDQHIQGMLTA